MTLGVCSSTYHVCQEVDGELTDTIMECPADLAYDMESDQCDYPENVEVANSTTKRCPKIII